MSREFPQVGAWYRNVEEDTSFEVVAFDEDEELIEIQFDTGEVEELDLDSWHDLPVIGIDPPQDWEGPFDDTEMDDRESRPRRRYAMDEESEEWADEMPDELELDEDE